MAPVALGRRVIGAVVLSAAVLPAAALETNINFLLGVKNLDADGAADHQAAFGIETTFGRADWPVHVALDALGSWREESRVVTGPVLASVDLTYGTSEFDFGVRKLWNEGSARPYVGGGFGILSGLRERNIQLLVVDDRDSTLGLWLAGGAFWRIGRRFNIGVDARLSGGEVTLFDQDVKVGGLTVGLLLGWGWGDR